MIAFDWLEMEIVPVSDLVGDLVWEGPADDTFSRLVLVVLLDADEVPASPREASWHSHHPVRHFFTGRKPFSVLSMAPNLMP